MNEISGKNGAVVDRYHRLKEDLLKSCGSVKNLIEGHDEKHVLLGELSEIQQELAQDTFKIGMFGVTAAGKSTLINALMRDSLLREGLGETTRTLSIIRHSDKDSPHGSVAVIFKTLEQINRELEKHLFNIGFTDEHAEENNSGGSCSFDDPVFRKKLMHFAEESDRGDDEEAQLSRKFVRYLQEGWERNFDRLGTTEIMNLKSSDDLVHNSEADACYVSERIIYHDCPITHEKFTFIDAPGVGSSLARHTEEAVKVAQSVDAAILVTKVDYKFMPADRKFLRDAMDVQRMQERHNLIFVLNQIGKINPIQLGYPPSRFDECVQEQAEKLQGRLAEEGIANAQILPIDAACGRWSRKILENSNDQEADDQLAYYEFRSCRGDAESNLKMSRIEEFETYLRNHLTDIRYISFLGSKKDRLYDLVYLYKNDLNIIINEYEEKIEILTKKLSEHNENVVNIKRTLDIYFEGLKEIMDKEFLDIEDGVKKIVEETADIVSSNYLNYLKKVSENGFKIHTNIFAPEIITEAFKKIGKKGKMATLIVSQKSFTNDVIKKTQEKIYPKIEEMRSEYEKTYIRVRDDALENQIPHIVSRYGSSIDFSISKNSIRPQLADALKGLENIKLKLLQRLASWLTFWNWEGSVRQKILKNYEEDFKNSFENDIRGWVGKDLSSFTVQIQTRFDQLMKSIQQRIEKQIEMANQQEVAKADFKQKLGIFIQQANEELARLTELEKEIERVRG